VKVFKFIVGSEYTPLRSNPDLAYKKCLAIAIAETEAEARAEIMRRAEEEGDDAQWMEIARVKTVPIPVSHPIVLAFVML
jgi:hypothetical protein